MRNPLYLKNILITLFLRNMIKRYKAFVTKTNYINQTDQVCYIQYLHDYMFQTYFKIKNISIDSLKVIPFYFKYFNLVTKYITNFLNY